METRSQPPLILASTSVYRRELLQRLRLPFTCVAPEVDESEWKRRGLLPQRLAIELASAKAASVGARAEADAVVIGSDQVCVLGEEILSKPGDRLRAIEQLGRLSGHRHQLLTAICIWQNGRTWSHIDVTHLTMRPLTSAEIERYVDADQPWDCAGSYKLEQLGVTLFTAIQSADQTAITGLPLIAVAELLRPLGDALP
ncbi:MAG: Maf family protein [Planctomycetota bacterium]